MAKDDGLTTVELTEARAYHTPDGAVVQVGPGRARVPHHLAARWATRDAARVSLAKEQKAAASAPAPGAPDGSGG